MLVLKATYFEYQVYLAMYDVAVEHKARQMAEAEKQRTK